MNKCFACDKKLGKNPHIVDTRDDQTVYVGSECYKLVMMAGEKGFRPNLWDKEIPNGNLRLYPLKEKVASNEDK